MEESLPGWETALGLARRETETNAKRKVVYTEHCARWGALYKANQAITSNSMSNTNPCNIDLLRAKHPEPAHPDRDPVSLPIFPHVLTCDYDCY